MTSQGAVASSVERRDRVHARWLLVGVAAVWVATGVLVVFPSYREVGASYLDQIGLPHWLMFVTCAFEVGLGLRVALGRPTVALAAMQLGMVAAFTIILAVHEPLLLAHPYGVLSKNLPLAGSLIVATMVWRDGFTPRTTMWLRVAMALPWMTEGLFPKLLFQQRLELDVVRASGLVPFDASTFLYILGAAQFSSGVLALVLRGTPRRVLLALQAISLVVLPLLVAWDDPLLFVHPFAPLLKNIPIIVGTLVLLRRSGGSKASPRARVPEASRMGT